MTTVEAPGLKASHQIANLRDLRDGWRNGEGVAFGADYLAWLSDAFSRMYPAHAPVPTICPTTYGIISIEWSLPGAEVSLEIDPETRYGDLLWASTGAPKSGETVIDMSEPEGWTSLADRLDREQQCLILTN